jgi:PiT family inorganic phosphate transporter
MHDLALITVVIVIALGFDITNGFHDTANAIATSVSTHALPPAVAVGLSALMNFVGAFFTLKVAATVGSGVAPPSSVGLYMIIAALLGAISWNLITWRAGIPSSSSHAIIGGLIGAVIVGLGVSGVQWAAVVHNMLIPLLISPVVGFGGSYLLMVLVAWTFRRVRVSSVNRGFRLAQIASSAFVAFSHGTNDAQKTMGVITLALISSGHLSATPFAVPIWVIFASASAMAVGTYAGGWRIIRTIGSRLYKIEPAQGFSAQTVSALTIEVASSLGFPVSTTHVVSGSVLGAGASKRLSAVRWGVGRSMLIAWIVTIPMAAIMAGVIYVPLHFLGK